MANNISAKGTPANPPQHILQLSGEEKQRFLDSFDRIYSDIDGVIWNVDVTVPNAAAGFNALVQAGKQLTFVTNNSVRNVEFTVQSFNKLGMAITANQIYHPAQTVIQYLRSIKFEGLIYIIATPLFKAQLRDAGFQLLDGPNQFIEEHFHDLIRNIFDKQPVRAVVIDVDFNLTSAKMLRADVYLRHPDCKLIIGATDKVLPLGGDNKIIGPGSFSSILVESSGKQPIVLGKPGRELGDVLMKHDKVSVPGRVLMVGDMLAQDIQFGRKCGFQTLLVLSGGCTLEQLQAETEPELQPDYYADSMADFVEFFAKNAPKAHF